MLPLTCCVLLAAAVALTTVEGVPCDADPCKSSPCKNGGACAPSPSEGNRYTCTCAAGFVGFYCEVVEECGGPDPCNPSPCRNGGSCASSGVDGQGYERYTCTCAAGFVGIDCEVSHLPPVTVPPGPCDVSPCKNHQTCSVVNNAAVCTCPQEYTGCDCQLVRPLNCPDGFTFLSESKSCIKILTSEGSFDQQKAACQKLHPNSDLAIVNSKAENDAFTNHIKTSLSTADISSCGGYTGYYIALQRATDKNCGTDLVWKSVDVCQAKAPYMDFGSGEPSCGGGSESCGQLAQKIDYQWNDTNCDSQGCAICEITLSGSI